MLYKIILVNERHGIRLELKDGKVNNLLEAVRRADLYANKKGSSHFYVINEETGDVEYETSQKDI